MADVFSSEATLRRAMQMIPREIGKALSPAEIGDRLAEAQRLADKAMDPSVPQDLRNAYKLRAAAVLKARPRAEVEAERDRLVRKAEMMPNSQGDALREAARRLTEEEHPIAPRRTGVDAGLEGIRQRHRGRVPVGKAKTDDPVPVFDQAGNLVGVCDQDAIIPVAGKPKPDPAEAPGPAEAPPGPADAAVAEQVAKSSGGVLVFDQWERPLVVRRGAIYKNQADRPVKVWDADRRRLGTVAKGAVLQHPAIRRGGPPGRQRGFVAKGAGGDDVTLVVVCDLEGNVLGVVDQADIEPVVTSQYDLDDMADVGKAAGEYSYRDRGDGSVDVLDDAGRLVGTFSPDGGLVRVGYAGEQQTLSPGAQARNTGPVSVGGSTGMGRPRTTGPAAALPGDGPQERRPGGVADRAVVKAAQATGLTAVRKAAAGVPVLEVAQMVAKASEPQRFVLGIAYQAGPDPRIKRGVDGGRDFISKSELEQACWSYMRSGAPQMNAFHVDGTEDCAEPVESFIWRWPDWDAGNGVVVKDGDWCIGAILSPRMWALHKAGMVNGLSPEGTARRRRVAKEGAVPVAKDSLFAGDDDGELTELTDATFKKVALVGSGANGIPRFLISKNSASGALLDAETVRALIAKADPQEAPAPELPGDLEARAIVKSLGPDWRMLYDHAGRLCGAVRQQAIRPAPPGHVLKAAAGSYVSVCNRAGRNVGIARAADTIRLADLRTAGRVAKSLASSAQRRG